MNRFVFFCAKGFLFPFADLYHKTSNTRPVGSGTKTGEQTPVTARNHACAGGRAPGPARARAHTYPRIRCRPAGPRPRRVRPRRVTSAVCTGLRIPSSSEAAGAVRLRLHLPTAQRSGALLTPVSWRARSVPVQCCRSSRCSFARVFGVTCSARSCDVSLSRRTDLSPKLQTLGSSGRKPHGRCTRGQCRTVWRH